MTVSERDMKRQVQCRAGKSPSFLRILRRDITRLRRIRMMSYACRCRDTLLCTRQSGVFLFVLELVSSQRTTARSHLLDLRWITATMMIEYNKNMWIGYGYVCCICIIFLVSVLFLFLSSFLFIFSVARLQEALSCLSHDVSWRLEWQWWRWQRRWQ